MRSTDVLIIGGGQAGLAMSHCLAGRGIDHVVIERGRIGERWRSERWDSLRLLTPNWMTRLPGHSYGGADPDGFLTRDETVALLGRYAVGFGAPVLEETSVVSVASAADGYAVQTSQGACRARAVVIATGACDRPLVPGSAAGLAPDLRQVTPSDYKTPHDLDEGGVLVVGASSTGLQLAREIHRSGRPVTLAAGRHIRMVRRYRGRDIFRWMAAAGITLERWTDLPNLAAARAQPSMQLGADGPLSLAALAAESVRVVGRLEGMDGAVARFGDNLARDCAASDARLARVLSRIDAHLDCAGIDAPAEPEAWLPDAHPISGATELDLRQAGIHTVLWATGYRRDYSWLKVPVLDPAGELIHEGGVTPAPGLYVLGLRILRHRASNFIDGVGRDAEELSAEIAARFNSGRLAA